MITFREKMCLLKGILCGSFSCGICTSGAPGSVTSTLLNAGITGCSLPGRSRLVLEESSRCEVSFHGDYVPDLAQVIPKGECKQLCHTQTGARVHLDSPIFIPNTRADFHSSALTSTLEPEGHILLEVKSFVYWNMKYSVVGLMFSCSYQHH